MDQAKQALQRASSTVQETVRNRGAVAVFVILTLMLIVVIIAYIVWRLNRTNMKGITLLKTPVRLDGDKVLDEIPASRMPAMHIGQEYAFSFWLYLSDFKATTNYKLLFTRLPTSALGNDRYKQMNPVVMLDKVANKMYICVLTNRSPTNPTTDLDGILGNQGVNKTFLVGAIDYVPLQRWVHVAFMIEDNLMSVFLDGSLYTVQTLSDMSRNVGVKSTALTAPLFAACTGGVRIGQFDTGMSDKASGFISNLRFFNYPLSAAQVSALYDSGPDTGFSLLRTIGVPEYGVRSPIYRVDDEVSSSNDAAAN
jgi:hypothetical protein